MESLRAKYIDLCSDRGVQSRLADIIGKKPSFFSEPKRGKPVNAFHLKAIEIYFGFEKLKEIMSIDAKNNIGKKIAEKSHPEDIDHPMEGNEVMDKNKRIDLLLRIVGNQTQTIERLTRENETLRKSIAASKKPDISNAANINQSGN